MGVRLPSSTSRCGAIGVACLTVITGDSLAQPLVSRTAKAYPLPSTAFGSGSDDGQGDGGTVRLEAVANPAGCSAAEHRTSGRLRQDAERQRKVRDVRQPSQHHPGMAGPGPSAWGRLPGGTATVVAAGRF